MTCAEFQKALPYIIDTGGNAEQEAHLCSCPVCSDLVADLKYIADQAKLLVPMEDPPERVWEGIQRGLEREGLAARPTGPRGRLLGRLSSRARVPWVAIAIAVTAVLVGLALYRHDKLSFERQDSHVSAAATAPISDDVADRQLLTAISERAPSLRATYEDNLRRVNAYISEARTQVQSNPDDPDARHCLMQAYQQKAMLYQMALGLSVP
jgi:hypothetical protein